MNKSAIETRDCLFWVLLERRDWAAGLKTYSLNYLRTELNSVLVFCKELASVKGWWAEVFFSGIMERDLVKIGCFLDSCLN
jgi:hypothetical protein